ncbi:hypothetical protein E7681_11760 [Thalassobius vesicularis]|uniref:D-galactarate dehydratase n=1 Tax=Thalassobius vesicularis TaxID=1294297 RepID=A0A4S3M9R2_9RHOB|nr:hypothetical protein [Thalassobius vesicularis]THD73367.1 hypothetical protein E7681_11760 [Thalassobius vesicularis]
MKAYLTVSLAVLAVSACTPMEKIGLDLRLKKDRPAEVQPAEPPVSEPVDVVPETPQTPDETGFLGVTVASLGDTSREGFWVETPLVSAPAKGSVRYRKTGRTVKVDLIPIAGPSTAGSRLSLATMRLLNAPLTGLPEVEIYRK